MSNIDISKPLTPSKGSLAFTHAGRMMQHIYFGMDLAIKAGAQMVLVRDGAKYAGFILKGKDLEVVHKRKAVKALSPAQLTIELQALNKHAAAVLKIYNLLIVVSRMDSELETVTQNQVLKSPRYIREMVQARRVGDIEKVKEEVVKALEDCQWVQTYWVINQENILKFLEAMVRGDSFLTEPMYPNADVIFGRISPILKFLSVFGPQAPSIFHGTQLRQIAKTSDDDPNLVVIDKKRVVPHIPYIKKGLVAAGIDWANVAKNKSFKYTPAKGDRPGGFSHGKARDGVIANPVFEGFYSMLRIWVYKEVVGKLKRKRGDEDEMDTTGDGAEAGPSSPSKKGKAVAFVME